MNDSDYQPAPHVLDRLRQVTLVAVVGPTAAGKTTLMKAAMEIEPAFRMALNNTSRPPRPGEEEGVDYYFHTREEMIARIEKGEYVQVAPTVLGDLYATAPEDYTTEGVAMLAVLADAMPTFRALPFNMLRTIYVVPPSWEEWRIRLDHHHFDAGQLQKRLAEAKRSLTFAVNALDCLFIINDDLTTAAERFVHLALGFRLTPEMEAEQQRGRDIARELLRQLY